MAIQRFGSSLGDDFMPQSFSSMLDRFFNESMQSRRKMADFTPHVDTCETESGFEIEVALPGLRKENVNIEFQEGRLTISGERRFENENKDKRYHVIESQYGSFTRSFQLPNNVNPEGISAQFQDGILKVSVPKDEQKTKKHQIRVKGMDNPSTGQVSGQNQNQISGESRNQSAGEPVSVGTSNGKSKRKS